MVIGNDLIDEVIRLSVSENDNRKVILGALVWVKRGSWHFFVAAGDDDDFEATRVVVRSKRVAERIRSALQNNLERHKPQLIVHHADDLRKMSDWCAIIWPNAAPLAENHHAT
jgi:hypothetical protein